MPVGQWSRSMLRNWYWGVSLGGNIQGQNLTAGVGNPAKRATHFRARATRALVRAQAYLSSWLSSEGFGPRLIGRTRTSLASIDKRNETKS